MPYKPSIVRGPVLTVLLWRKQNFDRFTLLNT